MTIVLLKQWCCLASRSQLAIVQNMPEDFLLRNVNGQDVWVSEGESDSVEIKAQSHVRIRIANVQLQPEKLVRTTRL